MSGKDLFREVRAKIAIKVLPSAIGDIRTAVIRELASMLLKSEPSLGGVPVAFSGAKIVGDSAGVFEDQPDLHLSCAVTFMLFSPSEGQRVTGVVNNSASDSVGLLVLNTFNASITADGLSGYVFDAGRSVWHKEEEKDDVIEMGQEMEFVCKAMKTHEKLVLISGELPHKSAGDSERGQAPAERSETGRSRNDKAGNGGSAISGEGGSATFSANGDRSAGSGRKRADDSEDEESDSEDTSGKNSKGGHAAKGEKEEVGRKDKESPKKEKGAAGKIPLKKARTRA